jgi:hypothetical protein
MPRLGGASRADEAPRSPPSACGSAAGCASAASPAALSGRPAPAGAAPPGPLRRRPRPRRPRRLRTSGAMSDSPEAGLKPASPCGAGASLLSSRPVELGSRRIAALVCRALACSGASRGSAPSCAVPWPRPRRRRPPREPRRRLGRGDSGPFASPTGASLPPARAVSSDPKRAAASGPANSSRSAAGRCAPGRCGEANSSGRGFEPKLSPDESERAENWKEEGRRRSGFRRSNASKLFS